MTLKNLPAMFALYHKHGSYVSKVLRAAVPTCTVLVVNCTYNHRLPTEHRAVLHLYMQCTYCQLYLWTLASHNTVPTCEVSPSGG